MRNHLKQSGFTIVELLIVIVVIGILAAITIVAYRGIQTRAQQTSYISNANAILKKAAAYKAVNGTYPTGPVYTDVIDFSSNDQFTKLPNNLRAFPVDDTYTTSVSYQTALDSAKGVGSGAPASTYGTLVCSGGSLDGFKVLYPKLSDQTIAFVTTGTC